MRIVVFTEGGIEKGFGHLSRCSSLYWVFREAGLSLEVFVNGDSSVLGFDDWDFTIFNWINDEAGMKKILKNTDMAIVDSYLAPARLYSRIAAETRVSLYFDDGKRISYPPGVIINGAIGADRIDYHCKTGTTYLLGSRYFPLRKSFRDVSERCTRDTVETLLLTMGGADHANVTLPLLELICSTYPRMKKKVLIGKAFQNIPEIEKAGDPNTEYVRFPDAERMKDVMIESDLAISAAGQTLYELARVGLPTIAIAVASDQLGNVEGWSQTGFITNAGEWGEDKTPVHVISAINSLSEKSVRQRMCDAGRRSIDGMGSRRIFKVAMNMLLSQEKFFYEKNSTAL